MILGGKVKQIKDHGNSFAVTLKGVEYFDTAILYFYKEYDDNYMLVYDLIKGQVYYFVGRAVLGTSIQNSIKECTILFLYHPELYSG